MWTMLAIRRLLPVMAIALALTTASCASARPTLLLIHGGGFLFGGPSLEDKAASYAQARGWRTVSLDYPLGNLPAAVAYSERAARTYGAGDHPVYAYGESAGGLLAALLAERGEVKAAATYSPVSDLVKYAGASTPGYLAYIGATEAEARRYSPALHQSRRRILALVGADDYPSIKWPTLGWAHRERRVRARVIPGGHIGGPGFYGQGMRRAIRFLDRQRR
jgi:acetyl esterase/lipase